MTYEPIPPVQPADPLPGVDALIAAHDRTVDAGAGFDKMAETAEPGFRAVASQFRDLHRRHADRLARMLADRGEVPSDGTVMGTVNRAVVATRAFFTDIDAGVMDSVRDGESHVVDAYEDALAAAHATEEQQALAEMLAELNDLLAETRHLG